MPVIAPFTEEELESMRGYDRKCSEKGDYRMDFIEKCIDDGARIAYRPDAAAKIRAMGMSLRAFAVQCGMGPSTVRSNMHREFCVTRASPLNTSFSGRRGEAVAQGVRTEAENGADAKGRKQRCRRNPARYDTG